MSCMIRTLIPVLLVSTLACGGNEPNRSDEQTATPSTGTPAGTAGEMPDRSFVEEQLAVGEKDIALAELVAQRATRPALKTFAENAARDHRQANENLRQIATRHQLNPTVPNEQLQTERDRLSKLSGEEFEREYLTEIIFDHQDAVSDLERATATGSPEIREWAAATLPIVRRHLEEARQLRDSMSQTGGAEQ